jgi:hypothetical protein
MNSNIAILWDDKEMKTQHVQKALTLQLKVLCNQQSVVSQAKVTKVC